MKTKDNKIDSLFRDRLDGYEIEPSEGAKEMMSRHITGRHSRRLYLRMAIAAGIAIVIASGIVLSGSPGNLLQDSREGTVTLSENDLINQPGNDNRIIAEIPPVNTLAVNTANHNKTENRKGSLHTGEKNFSKPIAGKAKAITDEITRPQAVEMLDSKFRAVALNDKINNTIPKIPEDRESKVTVKQSPVVIEYIADNDSTKSRKQHLVAGIVSKAREIGRDVNLGEIRDLKDQLFALDFIKPRKSK